jgi:hypothetical protein
MRWIQGRLAGVAAGALVCLPAAAAAQANGPLSTMSLPSMNRSVRVEHIIPDWVAMPATARILTSDGLEMRPLRNSAVTYENAKLGVLVGALTNTGGCARNLRLLLQYTDDHWQPLGDPIESEARVADVEPGGALPYRFRLKRLDEFPEAPSAYILQVVEEGKPVSGRIQWVSTSRTPEASPCPPTPLVIDTEVRQSRATLSGYRVSGTFVVRKGGPIRPDGVTLTALLRDADGDVLEVLTGIPTVREKDLPSGLIEDGQVLPFSLSTGVPLGKAVATTTIYTDVLADARAAPALPQ